MTADITPALQLLSDELLTDRESPVVYWGTSGQRIRARHDLSAIEYWQLRMYSKTPFDGGFPLRFFVQRENCTFPAAGCIMEVIMLEGGAAVTINLDEAMRYLGVSGQDAALRADLAQLSGELAKRITPRTIWRAFPADALNLPGRTAALMLKDCRSVIVLAATLGAPFDAWMRREQKRDMRRAVLLDALGSACIESVCDDAAADIVQRFPGQYLTDRFSPGYGDLPLDTQHMLLSAADAQRTIGITLTESLLMLPQKSVSALIGVADAPQPARVRGCRYCTLQADCNYRKAGKNCHVS